MNLICIIYSHNHEASCNYVLATGLQQRMSHQFPLQLSTLHLTTLTRAMTRLHTNTQKGQGRYMCKLCPTCWFFNCTCLSVMFINTSQHWAVLKTSHGLPLLKVVVNKHVQNTLDAKILHSCCFSSFSCTSYAFLMPLFWILVYYLFVYFVSIVAEWGFLGWNIALFLSSVNLCRCVCRPHSINLAWHFTYMTI